MKPKADTTTRAIIPFKGVIGRRGGRGSEVQGVSSTPRSTKAIIESRTIETTKLIIIQEHTTQTANTLTISNNRCNNSFFRKYYSSEFNLIPYLN